MAWLSSLALAGQAAKLWIKDIRTGKSQKPCLF
jgi:hypothetical protein